MLKIACSIALFDLSLQSRYDTVKYYHSNVLSGSAVNVRDYGTVIMVLLGDGSTNITKLPIYIQYYCDLSDNGILHVYIRFH